MNCQAPLPLDDDGHGPSRDTQQDWPDDGDGEDDGAFPCALVAMMVVGVVAAVAVWWTW